LNPAVASVRGGLYPGHNDLSDPARNDVNLITESKTKACHVT